MSISLNLFFASIASLYFALGTYVYLLFKLDLSEEWPLNYIILISVYFTIFFLLFISHYVIEYRNGNFSLAQNNPKVIKVKKMTKAEKKKDFWAKLFFGILLCLLFTVAEFSYYVD